MRKSWFPQNIFRRIIHLIHFIFKFDLQSFWKLYSQEENIFYWDWTSYELTYYRFLKNWIIINEFVLTKHKKILKISISNWHFLEQTTVIQTVRYLTNDWHFTIDISKIHSHCEFYFQHIIFSKIKLVCAPQSNGVLMSWTNVCFYSITLWVNSWLVNAKCFLCLKEHDNFYQILT